MDILSSPWIEMTEPEIIKVPDQNTVWVKLRVTKEKFKNTPKLFYNKYAFKADMDVPGSRLLRHASRLKTYEKFSEYVESRKATYARSTWDARYNDGASTKQLYSFYESMKKYGNKIRMRGELGHLSVCAETEEILQDVLMLAKVKGQITAVFLPASDEAMEKLKDGTFFVSNPKFKFRAMIRSAYYKPDVKKQILNYFENYKDSIIVSASILDSLRFDRPSYIKGYLHVDSTDVLLFLKMIHPRFIGKIFTLEQPEAK